MRTVLHTESSPGLGGQEIRTLNEARWIGERGWRVIVAGQPESPFIARAREAGLLVGISGGAALAGALKVAKTARNAVIVTIFPDSADKYMSERFWNAPA